ncbi:DNA-binding protein [Candidimonas sp. SYP-B2681]|uniref:Zn-ribbon domain-containing OB-fold protein n=1 Tax=Candidimonas sp. SYP-B2681 TaxID=2497686 RepID=UPI000F897C8B|nr:OB-fold domain-containing protein [Candidimonas sp. SYP-B2681]RTZ41490.1 DNA-binding protein [Candidimonas sp. SYP-B2681]
MSSWEKDYSAPIVDEDSEQFWTKACEKRLVIKHCTSCDKSHWYPRPRCPFCLRDNTIWKEASGTGAIYSYSVMRRAVKPYIVAFVTLDEGPSVLTNIVDCDPTRIYIGMRVVVTFRHPKGESAAIPVFRPADNKEGNNG